MFPKKDWFYGDVMFAYENGLMIGTGNAQFRPHGTATRGMIATILWRMAGSPAPKGNNNHSDVGAGTWYTQGRDHMDGGERHLLGYTATKSVRTIPSPVNSLQPSSSATQTSRAAI